MSELETTKEFTGEMGFTFFVAAFCCLPYGIYSYYSNKEQRVICPECKETADMQASTCPSCQEDLDQYR